MLVAARVCTAAVTVLLFSCSGPSTRGPSRQASAGSPAAAEGPPAATRFAWPVPARVAVHETSTLAGQDIELRYFLDITNAGGGALRVAIADVAHDRVGDLDFSDPANHRLIATMNAMRSNLPSFLVSSAGAFADLQGTDRYAEQIATLAGAPLSAVDIRVLEQELLEATELPWAALVGHWRLPRLPDVGESIVVHDSPHSWRRWTLEQTHDGGAVEMTLVRHDESTPGGEVAPEVMTTINSNDGIANVVRYTVTERASVLTHPRNLMPQRASSELQVKVWLEGQETPLVRSDTRRFELRFVAPTATGSPENR